MNSSRALQLFLFTAIAWSSGTAQKYYQPLSAFTGGGGRSSSSAYSVILTIGEIGGRDSSAQFKHGSGFVHSLEGAKDYFKESYALGAGWNMVSIPKIVADYRKITLYPSASTSAFAYQGLYVRKDTLENGQGYWIKFAAPQYISIAGTARNEDTIDVRQGWNIVGSLSSMMPKTDLHPLPPATIIAPLFGYHPGGGYFQEDTLEPGKAYWLKSGAAGKLVMSVSPGIIPGAPSHRSVVRGEAANPFIEQLSSISVADNGRRTRSVFFSSTAKSVDGSSFELPPVAPEGELDLRFHSQRSLEFPQPGNGNSREFQLVLNGGEFPVRLSWDVKVEDGSSVLRFISEGGETKEVLLGGIGSVELMESDVHGMKLIVGRGTDAQLPKEFALYQNFPNPFNPSTRIAFDIPLPSHVKLGVYTILGQEVTTLVDEERPAGRYVTEFDASRYASGMYFYELRAGTFYEVRKFAIVK